MATLRTVLVFLCCAAAVGRAKPSTSLCENKFNHCENAKPDCKTPWAKENCAKHCDLCQGTPPCKNKFDQCKNAKPDCKAPWAKENCAKYCGLCQDQTTPQSAEPKQELITGAIMPSTETSEDITTETPEDITNPTTISLPALYDKLGITGIKFGAVFESSSEINSFTFDFDSVEVSTTTGSNDYEDTTPDEDTTTACSNSSNCTSDNDYDKKFCNFNNGSSGVCEYCKEVDWDCNNKKLNSTSAVQECKLTCEYTYFKIPKRACTDSAYNGGRTLEDAKSACSIDTECSYVYDSGCDNTGEFNLCPSGKDTYSPRGSCLYEKKTERPCTSNTHCEKGEYCNKTCINGNCGEFCKKCDGRCAEEIDWDNFFD